MAFLAPKRPFVLLDDSRSGHPDAASYLYEDPIAVIAAQRLDEVADALAAIDAWTARGHFVAGWIGYEAGFALEPRLARRPLALAPEPLIWLGVFTGRQRFEGARRDEFWTAARPTLHGYALEVEAPGLDAAGYGARLARIKDYLNAGDVYQVNFTFPLRLAADGDPLALYAAVRRAQRVAHGAIVATGAWTVLSFSPELFVARRGDLVTCRPMKGTLARGMTGEEDAARAAALAEDAKSRAENLMIVDLLRNDLARVAKPGSVAVPRLFEVEPYQTLMQMTSTVTARAGASPAQLIRALFPCGSVTGAPKIRAMEIIADLEAVPRGVYTGAIGHVAPSGDLAFSVPIRTLVLDAVGKGRLGIGSGIVADSGAATEYAECLLKSRFLNANWPAFDVFETLGWTRRTGWRWRDRHLARLTRSAAYFGFPFDPAAAMALLEDAVTPLQDPLRGRLLLASGGALALHLGPAPTPLEHATIALAEEQVASDNPFLYHKTTHRLPYEKALEAARVRSGCFEVIFENERGEVTEGSFTNVFIKRKGRLLTPAACCGLLPGILRQVLLEEGRCAEAVLTRADLIDAEALYIGNALRGLIPARLLTS
ncbi:MAG: aminodeoxychorismate synthase component I [Pseudomonadota bacterium]